MPGSTLNFAVVDEGVRMPSAQLATTQPVVAPIVVTRPVVAPAKPIPRIIYPPKQDRN
jgi:hypothetical protein